MYRIDPERLDLFEEFKAKPFGPYSHELERLLNRLRMGPVKGGNGFNWRVAYHPTRPGVIELRRAEDGARYWAEGARRVLARVERRVRRAVAARGLRAQHPGRHRHPGDRVRPLVLITGARPRASMRAPRSSSTGWATTT